MNRIEATVATTRQKVRDSRELLTRLRRPYVGRAVTGETHVPRDG